MSACVLVMPKAGSRRTVDTPAPPVKAITAQKLAADVRTKVENPLRPLYIAAGAEYNDSGVDKTKTAPWGETVTHKAGHYYLNGLGDITEEQMEVIFVQTYPLYIFVVVALIKVGIV